MARKAAREVGDVTQARWIFRLSHFFPSTLLQAALGPEWFNMPAAKVDEETAKDLKVLQV